MKRIVVEFSNERLITPSGLSLVGAMLGKSGLVKRCNQMSVTDKRSQPQIKNGDILLTYVGILCQGKTAFDSVHEMEEQAGSWDHAEHPLCRNPAHAYGWNRLIVKGRDTQGQCRHVQELRNKAVSPVDIDVTPFDNSKTAKEGVSRTYKGYDGYAPIMAYIGTEGFLVNCELRMGKQHCQNGTPDFLRETLALCRHRGTMPPKTLGFS